MASFQGSNFSSSKNLYRPKLKFHFGPQIASPTGVGTGPKVAFIVQTLDNEQEYKIYKSQDCSLEDVKGFARCLTREKFRILDGAQKQLLYKGK